MKKILSIFMVALLAIPAMAAEPKEDRAARDYSQWLPAEGDFSIGFSIDPLASFVGNMFSAYASQNTLGDLAGEALYTNQASIMGEYMLTDQLGLRANLGFNFGYDRERIYLRDDKAVMMDPLSRAKVIDAAKYKRNGGSFAIGVDYRVGERAIQGVFGGGLIYGLNVESTTYTYGNGITEANQVPTSNYAYTSISSFMPSARVLKDYNQGANHFFGLYGTVGIEWFVAPKIALGANVNLNLVYEMGAQQYVQYEGWNVATSAKETFTELKSPGNDSFDFGIGNIGANLYVAFYF